MGELYFEMDDFEKAIFYLKKAEKLVETNSDKYMYPSITASLSASYLQMGQIVNSQIYYDKMNYWLNESDLKFDDLYHVYINYIYQKGAASYFLKLKQYEKANKYALEGLNAIKQGLLKRKNRLGKFENYSMNLLKILYVANSNQKKYEKAFLYLRELHEKQFIHQKSELNNRFHELNLKYQTEQNKLKITALENENLKKEAEKQTTFRLSFAVLVLLLLLVIGIVYYSNFRLRKKNKEISEAMLKGQTTERKRVASDLHDNLGSTMSSIRWAFQSIDRNKWSDDEKEIFSNVQVMFDKAYDDIRLLSHNLLPEEFERFGLETTLQNFIRKININTTINFNLTISEGFKRMDNRVEFELYSICLELVNNIMKHSQATQAKIDLFRMKNQVKLSISDNGVGIFNNDSDGKGMKNVQARVDSLNGTWKIQNIKNRGFVNEILIPV
jgi:signal transduction histidine kinase